ncbi:MAG TPA: glycine cleavage system protein GcvH [Actinomycetota bacterium]|nr:glycine cleavage system protein GcvH [Actinomycetota bacterium]
MTAVRNCNIPDDLLYLVKNHVWARRDGDLVVCGITDVAQNLAKSFISFTPKKVGKSVVKGKSTATLESGKWVGPVPAPVAGEIVEINEAGQSDPTIFNRDPYGDGWVAKIKPEDWDRDIADLLTGQAALDAYEAFMQEEGIECGG